MWTGSTCRKSNMSSSGYDNSDETAEKWVQWFCSLPGNEFFCEVEEVFIEDAFNLYGLRSEIPNFKECLELILDAAPADDKEGLSNPLFRYAKDLYGLIHARFIVTSRGISLMLAKYENREFGHCPRALCHQTPTLPVGLNDELRLDSVKLYCPCCEEIYECPSDGRLAAASELDGSFFGPSFPHLLLLGKPQLQPPKSSDAYVPRIFGFKVRGQRGRLGLSDSIRVGDDGAEDEDEDDDEEDEDGDVGPRRPQQQLPIHASHQTVQQQQLQHRSADPFPDGGGGSSAAAASGRGGSGRGSGSATAGPSSYRVDAGRGHSASGAGAASSASSSAAQQYYGASSSAAPSAAFSASSSSAGRRIEYPGQHGTISDPTVAQIRHGRPLTSPWVDPQRRPEADDFNSDSDVKDQHRPASASAAASNGAHSGGGGAQSAQQSRGAAASSSSAQQKKRKRDNE